MILHRLFDDKLAQTSYLIGCDHAGEAVVIDPNRDIQSYLDLARSERLRITHVAETHIHADFVSGSRELAQRAGARLLLSAHGGGDWSYRFAAAADAALLRDGDRFRVGEVELRVMHTPGHTPEHLSFVVTDTARGGAPVGIATGDFLFVGDVGRPDLLERAAGVEGSMAQAARSLYHSLQRVIREVPDFVQVWPGHGSGSACGKALGAVPQSTIGYEKRFNWALAETDEERFVRAVLAGQPEPPMYFAEMKRINRDGPPAQTTEGPPARLSAEIARAVLAADATLLDLRPAAEFQNAHLPGSISAPAGRSFSTYVGSVVPISERLVLLASESEAIEAARDLAMIGYDDLLGFVPPDQLPVLVATGLDSLDAVTPESLQASRVRGELVVVDVRGASEWECGHIPGSLNLPLSRLPEGLSRLPPDRELVVHCQSGARAAVAASVLRAAGFTRVRRLAGDFAGWRQAGLEVASSTEPAPG